MDDYNPANPHTCRCGKRWTGLRTCHCTTCHHTFGAIYAFDAHRRNGKCIHPTDAGLTAMKRPYLCWGKAYTGKAHWESEKPTYAEV